MSSSPRIDEVDDCLARFEKAWQAQPPARLEEFLPADSAARRRFLQDAVPIDLEYRWCRSNGDALRPSLDDYLQQFPDLGSAGDLPVFLIGEEYRVRRWAGDCPDHADYELRFPAQAAQLKQTLAAIDDELARQPPPRLPDVASPPTSADALRAELIKLELLTAEQQVGNDPDVAGLARTLVQRGWLTPFQADVAVRGRAAQLVVGSYVLLERIGSGWSSNVFRARHKHLARTVALKVFRRELLQGVEPAAVKRFYQEMRAVGRLSHPNVVLAYDAGPVGPSLFLAMEYVGGADLHNLVTGSGPLPTDQAADFVYQAALGLGHAFENGLVHRDVKPSNLLLVAEDRSAAHPWGRIKLLDLGLARIHQAVRTGSASALTRTGCLMGTADFMAPEQGFDPRSVDIRADLYSLGCTWFFLLTGKPPFAGGTFLQKMNRHRTEDPPPVDGLPPELARTLRRLLAKNPEDRVATPADLCAALETFLPAGNRSQPGGRHRKSVWLAAALLTAALFGGLILWPRDKPPAPPTPKQNVVVRQPELEVIECNGPADIRQLPDMLIAGSAELTLETRFRTRSEGVLFGYQDTAYPQRPGQFVSALYVGTDGRLHGDLWNKTHYRLASTEKVNDGQWHHAALVAARGRIILYLDGSMVDENPGTVDHLRMVHNQIGTGFTSDHPAGNNDWFPFRGQLAEPRIWQRGRSQTEIGKYLDRPLDVNGAQPAYPARQ
ncbi:MAG: protein kinase [Gemmataceae bacterium]